jgi:hypothetical protein
MEWARILAYITGTVDQDLLLRNEYLAAENRILKGYHPGVVPKAHCTQVRWLEATSRSRPAADQRRSGSIDCPHGQGEPLLGL